MHKSARGFAAVTVRAEAHTVESAGRKFLQHDVGICDQRPQARRVQRPAQSSTIELLPAL
jgi:hypothetical protein